MEGDPVSGPIRRRLATSTVVDDSCAIGSKQQLLVIVGRRRADVVVSRLLISHCLTHFAKKRKTACMYYRRSPISLSQDDFDVSRFTLSAMARIRFNYAGKGGLLDKINSTATRIHSIDSPECILVEDIDSVLRCELAGKSQMPIDLMFARYLALLNETGADMDRQASRRGSPTDIYRVIVTISDPNLIRVCNALHITYVSLVAELNQHMKLVGDKNATPIDVIAKFPLLTE